MENISGRFLIAVPGLDDENFRQSVVLVCEHTAEGAFGLIINRVLMNSFRPLMKALEIKRSVVDMPIFYGGPVRPDQGYVIYTPFSRKYGQMKINDKLGVTASKEILQDIAEGKGPEKYLFSLGFAGWAADQLEDELMIDSWLVAPLKEDIIFDVDVAERWKAAARSMGVDFERFIHRSGFA